MNALDLFQSTSRATFISLGCPHLDAAVGGIPAQGITEISGEAGCGKTQLCLALALQVQLDAEHGGRSGSAAYLSCGEGTFPIRRLSQMAMCYENKTGIPNQQFLSNVHIEHCYNTDDAQSILRHKIPELCQQQNVKLLIIDSLAGLVRFEYDNRSAQEMKARTVLLFNLARELKLLADIFKLSIVVVNQVKADFIDTRFGEGNASIPALGMAWSYCVNTRISLHRNTAAIRANTLPADDDYDVRNMHAYNAHTECSTTVGSVSTRSVKIEPNSVGTKRGFDCVAPAGATHAYSRVFNDAFYADSMANVCAVNACADTSNTKGSVAVCSGTKCSTADKENSSTNIDTAASGTGSGSSVASVKAEAVPAVPRAIAYYSYAGVGVGGDSIQDTNSGGGSGGVARSARCIRLDFSPCKASAECAYEITHAGIHGVAF